MESALRGNLVQLVCILSFLEFLENSNSMAKNFLSACGVLMIAAVVPSAHPSAFSQQTTAEPPASESSDQIATEDLGDNNASGNDEGDTVEATAKSETQEPWKRDGATHFMRIRKDRKGRPVSLDTSVTRYQTRNSKGQVVNVDLIGAVHIGEKKYYEDLNKRFEGYDALLYELVAPEGTVIPKGGRESGGIVNPIAAMQKGMQAATGLTFQLDHIDYTKDNFVHADMSPEEFGESMRKNDESLGGYALKAIGQSMAMQASGKGDASMGMLMAMFSSNPELGMRRAMAKQIQNMDAGMIIFEGKDGSTIINHRNAKCMEVLQREIEAGKTSIGIFYGAGHLAEMEQRMLTDFSAKRGGQFWMTAWKLTKRTPKR